MDMIPASYRTYITQLRTLRRWGLILLSITLSFIVAMLSIHSLNSGYEEKITVLEHNKAITSQQRLVLESLQSEYRALDEKHDILVKLRGGAAAAEMFINIDQALDDEEVWFTSWEFLRAGSITDEKPGGVHTGYFIIIPADGKHKEKNAAWKIQTHMQISGQALDHESLSGFVRSLLTQPQIRDVRVQNTHRNLNVSNSLVDFKLIVVVDTRMEQA